MSRFARSSCPQPKLSGDPQSVSHLRSINSAHLSDPHTGRWHRSYPERREDGRADEGDGLENGLLGSSRDFTRIRKSAGGEDLSYVSSGDPCSLGTQKTPGPRGRVIASSPYVFPSLCIFRPYRRGLARRGAQSLFCPGRSMKWLRGNTGDLRLGRHRLAVGVVVLLVLVQLSIPEPEHHGPIAGVRLPRLL